MAILEHKQTRFRDVLGFRMLLRWYDLVLIAGRAVPSTNRVIESHGDD